MKLYLHIGYGKTGTSALQTYFALNRDILEEYNIYYPYHQSLNAASLGKITSGNLTHINWKEDIEKAMNETTLETVLFSNESLFHCILNGKDKISEISSKYHLKLILYVRNPLEHLLSVYGQYIKRTGYTEKISDWMHIYNYQSLTLDMINLCESLNIELKIINYSNVKSSLERSFLEQILLPEDKSLFLNKSKSIENRTVNRSLSRVEYEIQRQFNKRMGAESSSFISDILVNKLPHIKSEKLFISANDMSLFIQKNSKIVSKINSYLDDDNKISIDDDNDIELNIDQDIYVINNEQIEVLTESICNKIQNTNSLLDEDAPKLRDIAFKYDSKKLLSLEDAEYLMSLAKKARPEGPVIKEKFLEYNEKLNNKKIKTL